MDNGCISVKEKPPVQDAGRIQANMSQQRMYCRPICYVLHKIIDPNGRRPKMIVKID